MLPAPKTGTKVSEMCSGRLATSMQQCNAIPDTDKDEKHHKQEQRRTLPKHAEFQKVVANVTEKGSTTYV